MLWSLSTLLAMILATWACDAFAAEAVKVKVAFIAGYTGSDPNTARELDRGLQAFLATHPEAERKLAIKRIDNKGSIAESIKAIEDASRFGAKIIVGIARSDEALAAAKESARTKTLFITPFATNAQISEQSDQIFQICFNDEFQGRALAKLVRKDLKSKRVLVLTNTESVYSVGLSKSFQDSVGAVGTGGGGFQIKTINYTENDLNIEKALSTAREFKPDVVVISDHITRASQLAKGLRAVDPGLKFIGGDGFGGKKILSGVFNDSVGIELFYTTHWHRALENPTNKLFISGYEKVAKSEEPTTGAAMTFDAFSVIWSSLKANDFKDEPASLAQYIHRNKFSVTTGSLSLSKGKEKGAKKAAIVMHLKNGAYGVFKNIEP